MSLEIRDTTLFKELTLPQELRAMSTVLSGITNVLSTCSHEQPCSEHLRNCVKLRQLTLVFLTGAHSAPVLAIPNMLEHLWVHYHFVTREDVVQDEFIVDTIRRLPNLKTQTITNRKSTEQTPEQMVFEEVPAYCSEKGIGLINIFYPSHRIS